MTPEVTIVTPTFNSEDFIASTIASVQAQSFKNWEMIVVDDASSDRSHSTASKIAANDSRIRPVRVEKNGGAAVARNLGISLALGRYIAFLDADDLWYREKLSQQLAFMKNNSYYFSFTSYDRVTVDGESIGHVDAPSFVTYEDIAKSCSIGCLTVMFDTDFYGKVYMPEIRRRQDFGLWLRLLRAGPGAHGLNERLAAYTVRHGSISSNKLTAAKYNWRVYRQLEKLPIHTSMYYFLHYATNGVARRLFLR